MSIRFHEFKGNPDPVEIFEVGAEGIAPFLAPENSGKAKRAGESASGERPDASPSALSMEVLSPEVVRGSDVFLNYAEIDDQPLTEGKPGWVSELHRNLQVRVEQLAATAPHR